MENQNSNVEDKIMAEIKSGRVRPRSKYVFLAEKLGLGSAFALSVLLAVLVLNLVLFYLKASDNLGYLTFGSRGWLAFLESFPYLPVTFLIVLVFVAGFIMKKSAIWYQKPFGRLAVGLVVAILALGVILTFTNIAERIENEAFGRRPAGALFRPFFGPGLKERGWGMTGRAVEIGEDVVRLQTPRGTETIDLTKLEMPLPQPLRAGMFVMAVGERTKDGFQARVIRIVDESDFKMIERGVHRRFGSFVPPPSPTSSLDRRCQSDCEDTGDGTDFCPVQQCPIQ